MASAKQINNPVFELKLNLNEAQFIKNLVQNPYMHREEDEEPEWQKTIRADIWEALTLHGLDNT